MVTFPAITIPHYFPNNYPPLTSTPICQIKTATVLLVDIAGFTSLTNQLASESPQGAERIGRWLDGFFNELTQLVENYGGDIGDFAGDGLLAIWASDSRKITESLRQGLACALAIRAVLDNKLMDNTIPLRLHLALDSGELLIWRLGGYQGSWRLLYGGMAVREAAAANRQAGPGQVVMTQTSWLLLQDQVRSRRIGKLAWIEGLRHPVAPQGANSSLSIPSVDQLSFLSNCLAGPLAMLAWEGGSRWSAALRFVTTVFIGLPRWSHPGELALAQEMLLGLQQVIVRWEGSVLTLMMDDRGGHLLAVFGLPPFSHEDDPWRALAAARQCRKLLANYQESWGIGIASGRVFCGVIGGKRRRTYTVVGETVNLAARFQVAMPGQLLCDSATRLAIGERVEWHPPWAISLRGYGTPVTAWSPQEQLPPSPIIPTVPLVGRETEQRILNGALAQLQQQGQGGLWLVEGEAGIGKSRLVRGLSLSSELSVLRANGDAVERTSPYHPWRILFAPWLAKAAQQLPPVLQPYLPLLGSVGGVPWPESLLTQAMTGEARAHTTRTLLVALLGYQLVGPSLLILEDLHWFDSLSWGLLQQLTQDLPQLLIIATTRPLSDGESHHYRWLKRQAHYLVLEALPPAQAEQLACYCLGTSQLPPAVLALVADKAHGHPFFIEELVHALRDKLSVENGQVVFNMEGNLGAITIPDTLQGLVTHRIDGLPPGQQLALKVASVIGRVFAGGLVQAVYPVVEERPQLPSYLDALGRLELTRPQEGELAYIFKHVITQEVAYNLLLYTQRQELHGAVARWYEDSSPDLPSHYPLLAHHWLKAEVHDKALHYLEKAGQQALRTHASQEAVDFFCHALTLANTVVVPASRRAGWCIALAQGWWELGKLEACHQALEQGLSILGRPLPRRGLLGATLVATLTQIRHRLILPQANPSQDRWVLQAYEQLTHWAYFTHHPLLLIYGGLRALNWAERWGNDGDRARGYGALAVVAGLLPAPPLAEIYAGLTRQALVGVTEPATRAYCHKLLAIHGLRSGQWDLTAHSLKEGLAIAQQLGDARQRDEGLAQSFELALFQGNLAAALNQAHTLLRLAQARQDSQAQAWGICGILLASLRLGQIPAASLIAQGEALSPKVLQVLERLWLAGVMGTVALVQGQRARALAKARQVSRLAQLGGATSVGALEGHAGAAQVYLTLWEQRPHSPALAREARRACQRLLNYARRFPVASPRANALNGWRLALAGQPRRAQKSWTRALASAEALAMPWEQHQIRELMLRHR